MTSRPNYADVTEFLPQFKQMAEAAGRSPATLPISIFGAPENLDRLQRYRDQGITRVVAALLSASAAEILPVLDRWAELIRQTVRSSRKPGTLRGAER